MRITQTERAILTVAPLRREQLIDGMPYLAVLALAADHAVSIMADKLPGYGYFLAEDVIAVTWLRDVLIDYPEMDNELQSQFTYVWNTLTNLRDARRGNYHEFVADVLAGPGTPLDALIAEYSWVWAQRGVRPLAEAQKGFLMILQEAIYELA